MLHRPIKLLSTAHRQTARRIMSSNNNNRRSFQTNTRANIPSITFETLSVTRPAEYVVQVELNRPSKRNALNIKMWQEVGDCFEALHDDPDCRVILFTGAGKCFCAGLDFEAMSSFGNISMNDEKDTARKYKAMFQMIINAQEPISKIEKCQKPVIGLAHNACLGGGVGLFTPCDIRYATQDVTFSIREVQIGIASDIGPLQRIPKQTGNDSTVRELAFTARDFYADEAYKIGYISRIFQSKADGLSSALALAKVIASKSPVAVQGSKINLNYARDHSVDEALQYHATWNAANLQSEDTIKAAMAAASRQKEPPTFSKL